MIHYHYIYIYIYIYISGAKSGVQKREPKLDDMIQPKGAQTCRGTSKNIPHGTISKE